MNWMVVQKRLYYIVIHFCVIFSSNIRKVWKCVLKFCYKIAKETQIREMYQNAKPWFVSEMARFFVKKWMTSHSFDFRNEININICRYHHALKNLGIDFFIDICTRHRKSSKNVDLNICAYTWHSVPVMGHKQGFEPELPI